MFIGSGPSPHVNGPGLDLNLMTMLPHVSTRAIKILQHRQILSLPKKFFIKRLFSEVVK